MLEDDLRQLQRLGIDIWVSPQRARDLIAAGRATSLVEVTDTQSTERVRSSGRTERKWVQRRSADPTSTSPSKDADARYPHDERRAVKDSLEDVAEKSTPKPFTVQLRVYLFGAAAMLIERSSQCPDLLILDMLRALSGFEEHELNELHFNFPLVGRSNNAATIATLSGAQEGFQAWFDQRATNCKSLLLVGRAASDTAARIEDRISRTISINEPPLSRAGKQQLWNQIKNLND